MRVVKSIKGLTTVTTTLVRHTEETLNPKLFDIPKLVADPDLNLIKMPNAEMMKIKK